jgi:polynucleotide kinase-phosphatase
VTLTVPELSLVVLIGASGSGKSTFGRSHFKPTEVISSDFCRGLVSDDENDMAATDDAFDILHAIVAKRLDAGRLTVVDATNVQAEWRRPLLSLAKKYHCEPVAIVFDLPESLCFERNRTRTDRTISVAATRRQVTLLRGSIDTLAREGFRNIYHFRSVEEVEAADVVRQRLACDLRDDPGPFDIIGDVHGCYDELTALLAQLGQSRKIIFLGDLVDRGPNSVDVLRVVMEMVAAGTALCVPGNHDVRLLRALNGRSIALTHGLAETLAQFRAQAPAFVDQVRAFLDGLVSHYVLDARRLVVAHAGMKREMQGRVSSAVSTFALYGETTGEADEIGVPVRMDWAETYRGHAMVVYGHTPVREPQWRNRTINIDTGCVFGGRLTALRYPERELVSVPAARAYSPAMPTAAS